jgi:hypothetical protein
MEHTAESLEEFEKRMQETMGSRMYREGSPDGVLRWAFGAVR